MRSDTVSEFLQSFRDRYIVGQALHVAVESLRSVDPPHRENSNIEDMEFLIENAFPYYRALAHADISETLEVL